MGYCKLKKGICDSYYPCKICQHSKITNADRIRAMTDEELVKFLEQVECGTDFEEEPNGKDWAWWLQQPCEGD